MAPLLEVRDLRVSFDTEDGVVRAVDGIGWAVDAGRTRGVVGASGSGKTVASLSVLGLTRARNARVEGSILLAGRELLSAPEDELRRIRGNDVAMIFQDPLSSLHPFFRIGDQLAEAVLAHRDVTRRAASARALEMLELVGLPDARRRIA
ncbi:MAG: peptide/nickel transport system ATP-binding protein, partial [Solirubrobacteraceae bacterium]|nr:peptide/nickel transport system ATP-binding protein [Solirubrobacteraceae bacterium]